MTTLVASCLGRLKDIGISSKSRRRTLGPRLSRRASHPSDCLRWYLAQVAILVSAALRYRASQDLKHLTQRPRKLPLELVVVLGVSGALSLWGSGPYAGSIHPDYTVCSLAKCTWHQTNATTSTGLGSVCATLTLA